MNSKNDKIKSTKNNNNKSNNKSSSKNIKIWGIMAAFIVVTAFFLVYDAGKTDTVKFEENLGPIPTNGENLIITKSEIDKAAKFFPYRADGVIIELMAFKAADGTIRTAFNTCQVCYDSGLGYYVQNGDVLICQNCGNRYAANRVGIEKGGCNPIPIMPAERTEDNEIITIPGDLIVQHKNFFTKWKKS